MRSSSVVLALAAAAAVTPAFAAPVSSTYSSQQTTGSDESGAVKLGNIADVASIGSSVVSVLHNLFGGSGNQQRRDELEVLLARAQNELDESGAISFDTIKNIGSIGGSAISILHNLFGGSNNQQRDVQDESGAVKLGNIADVASIGSSVVSVLHNLFGGSGNQQRRDELEALFARAQNELDESGAISFDTIKNIGSIGGSAISILHNLFGGSSNNQQRDVSDDSGALKLGDAANIASIGSSVVSVFHNLFGGNNKREFEELLARQDTGLSQSDAIKLGTLSTIFSVGAPVIGGIIDHFKNNGNQQQRRELEELFARQSDIDQSDAIKLGTLGTIFSVGAPIIGGIIDHFKNGDQQQRRELEELFARQSDIDQSDAIKLGTLGTIFSVGAPIIGGIIDHFKNGDQQQRRELEELFARGDESAALNTLFSPFRTKGPVLNSHTFGVPKFNIARQETDVDQSDAIKLGTLGTIFSVGAPIIGGIIDHFKNGDQQQRRELEELFARQSDIDQSDAIKLGTLGTIFSVGAPIIGGIIDHFKGNDNQRREFEELLARGDTSGALSTLLPAFRNRPPFRVGIPVFPTRSLNELD